MEHSDFNVCRTTCGASKMRLCCSRSEVGPDISFQVVLVLLILRAHLEWPGHRRLSRAESSLPHIPILIGSSTVVSPIPWFHHHQDVVLPLPLLNFPLTFSFSSPFLEPFGCPAISTPAHICGILLVWGWCRLLDLLFLTHWWLPLSPSLCLKFCHHLGCDSCHRDGPAPSFLSSPSPIYSLLHFSPDTTSCGCTPDLEVTPHYSISHKNIS